MQSDDAAVTEPKLRRGRLVGAGSTPEMIGACVAGVFLVAMAAGLWWSLACRQRVGQTNRADRLRASAELIVEPAQTLLAAGDSLGLQRLMRRAVVVCAGRCRVELPDGTIIADSSGSFAVASRCAANWPGESAQSDESRQGRVLTVRRVLDAGARGQARLILSDDVGTPVVEASAVPIGHGAVAVGALLTLLGVYRWARSRFRGIGSVRQALLAIHAGESQGEALEVSPTFGPEAQAWNALLAQRQDTQDRQAVQEAEASLASRSHGGLNISAACDALPHGLVLIDADGRAIYANGAAVALLQIQREDVLQSDLSELIEDERVIDAARSAATGPTYKRSIVEVARGGSTASGVLRFIVRPVRREDSGVAMIIIEDITQKRVAEEARNAFLAQATHELRTPLTNIRLYVEAALEAGPDDQAITGKSLNVINEESRRLERVVSDILSVSEIEAGSFKIRPDDVRLDALFEQLRADHQLQAKDKQIELTFDLPPKLPVIHADRDKIALALHNLLGNALKYTPAGGEVSVRVSVGSGELTVEMVDTGIGIGDDDVGKVFEKFYRANDARLANVTGSGLGLALAREVIRLHGGDIEVQSQLNKGSTFTLTLPLSSEVE